MRIRLKQLLNSHLQYNTISNLVLMCLKNKRYWSNTIKKKMLSLHTLGNLILRQTHLRGIRPQSLLQTKMKIIIPGKKHLRTFKRVGSLARLEQTIIKKLCVLCLVALMVLLLRANKQKIQQQSLAIVILRMKRQVQRISYQTLKRPIS